MDRDSARCSARDLREGSNYQLIILIGYIVVLSVYLIGGPQWIDRHLPSFWINSERSKFFITLTKKLLVFVAIPFAIFRFGFGYRIRDFGIQREGLYALWRSHLPVVLVVGGAFLVFQYFISGGGAAFRHGHFTAFQLLLGLPLCFIWLSIEAGLVEEFFFRALVQSQLAAAFKSEISGIVLMSLIFGLAHAPRFYLSPCWRTGRTRLKSQCARRDCLFDRRPGSERNHVRRNLGANEKSVRAYAHPRGRRSPAQFWQLHTNVVLITG